MPSGILFVLPVLTDIPIQFVIALLSLTGALDGTISITLPDTERSTVAPLLATNVAPARTETPFSAVPTVPFYSQFNDITDPQWKKVGCGITSLAMLIEYYKPQHVSVDTLLRQGIASGAYLNNVGWTYAGLIGVSNRYGLSGTTRDFGNSTMDVAFAKLEASLAEGPVMVSVHYTFDPQNPIPHLVVANGIRNGRLYYNDPAEKTGGNSISLATFKNSWKKRYIEIRPVGADA